MERLRFVVKLFTMITSGVLLSSAVYITLFWGTQTDISIMVLWQILGSSALCSLCGFCYTFGKKEPSKREMLIRNIISFAYVNAVVLGCAFGFEWIRDKDPRMIAVMELSIIIVFAGVYSANYISDCREADKMNRKLQNSKKG